VRAAWTIAKKDLALRVRDRSVAVIGLIAPLALAFVFDAVLGDVVAGDTEALDLSFAVVDLDDGPLGGALTGTVEAVSEQGLATFTELDSEAAATAVDAGDVDAVFVVPAGMSADYSGGGDVAVEVVGDVDSPTAVGIAAAIAERFATGARTGSLAAAAAAGAGVIGAEQMAAAAMEAAGQPPPITLGSLDAVTRQLDPATSLVAGLTVFFMFFVAGTAVTSMLEERQEGTMARLLAAPIGTGAIIAGKAITSILIGLFSLTVLILVSGPLLGAEWGHPVGVALLVVAVVLAVVAVMSLAGGLAKTPEQAANLQAIVAVSFALLGGTFVPVLADGGLLARLQYATPNGLFVRGLADLAGGGPGDAVPAVLGLLAMALVAAVLALAVLRRRVKP
jgi:ABC-2 type transport system permease protein